MNPGLWIVFGTVIIVYGYLWYRVDQTQKHQREREKHSK